MSANYPLTPLAHPLHASVRVPGSKSLTNRALLLAALADGPTTFENALFSDDSARFADSLVRLGFAVHLEESAASMTVHGLGGRIPNAQAQLFVGNAGTAARFLTAMLTLGHGEYVLDGDARMRQRPIGDLVDALRQLGAIVEALVQPSAAGGGQAICPPLRIRAGGLPGGSAEIAGNISSQYLSGLLMIAPYAQTRVELSVVGGLNSKPYVDMTLAIMADFGVNVRRSGYERFAVDAQRYRAPGSYTIESDASAASYFFAAPAVCGGVLRVENITRNAKQGDVAFLDILAAMGCTVTDGDTWIEVSGPGRTAGAPALRGIDVDMRDIPDMAQTLAAIAPFAGTATTIRGIESARLKETDRVSAMCTELTRLGVSVVERRDGLTIQPCRTFRPATIKTYNDHRMAMAFALIGLRTPGVTIADPGCVAKTFPNYFEVLESLRNR
ncbi:MAG: 3-phosphoshikimate 1-carboxyvinyltransferase [Chloroflexota bacterium]